MIEHRLSESRKVIVVGLFLLAIRAAVFGTIYSDSGSPGGKAFGVWAFVFPLAGMVFALINLRTAGWFLVCNASTTFLALLFFALSGGGASHLPGSLFLPLVTGLLIFWGPTTFFGVVLLRNSPDQ